MSGAGPSSSRLVRLGWFAALYAGGVLGVGLAATVLRLWLKA